MTFTNAQKSSLIVFTVTLFTALLGYIWVRSNQPISSPEIKPDIAGVTTNNGITQNVLSVVYYKGHNPASSFNYTSLIQSIEQSFEQGSAYKKYKNGSSQPFVNINMTTIVHNATAPQQGANCDQYLPQIWAGNWTTSNWQSTNCWGSGTADYYAMLENNNICNLVNNGTIDEVWFFAFGYGGFWEASMTGTGAYYTNGGVYTGTNCNQPVHVMGFTYERGADAAMHSLGHRIEGTMRYFLGAEFTDGFDTLNYRYNYNYGQIYSQDNSPSCGNIHWPPNGQSHYDYANSNPVMSDCDNWNPQHNGTRISTGCSKWGCNELGYMIWWMQNLPGKNNYLVRQNGTLMPNWWGLIMSETVLVDIPPTPTPTSPPTPTPTVTNTPTPTPTFTPTFTPTPNNTGGGDDDPTPTPTRTPTPTPTLTPTNTLVPTPTFTPTPTLSPTPTPIYSLVLGAVTPVPSIVIKENRPSVTPNQGNGSIPTLTPTPTDRPITDDQKIYEEEWLKLEVDNESILTVTLDTPTVIYHQDNKTISGILFKGKTLPNSAVNLAIFSNKIEVSTVSDNQGLWEVILVTELGEGEHTVYATVTVGTNDKRFASPVKFNVDLGKEEIDQEEIIIPVNSNTQAKNASAEGVGLALIVGTLILGIVIWRFVILNKIK